MAIGFNQTKGSAQKEKIETYNYAGREDHHLRMIGDLLPRYVYWIKGENNKNIPMECLSFDRNSETFNNKEHDHVRDFYPDLKCGWSYAVQCIDYSDKSVKVLNLKRKLFDQMIVAMEELGEPTDPVTGNVRILDDFLQADSNICLLYTSGRCRRYSLCRSRWSPYH